jgi:hypothetical protein
MFNLVFEINDNGTIETLTSDPLEFDPADSLSLADVWCFVVIVLEPITQTLTMYLNNTEIGSITLNNRGITPLNDSTFFIGTEQHLKADTTSYIENKIPIGFIDETGISSDNVNTATIAGMWNNGIGDFYIS